jgi:hypothetical protein
VHDDAFAVLEYVPDAHDSQTRSLVAVPALDT